MEGYDDGDEELKSNEISVFKGGNSNRKNEDTNLLIYPYE